MKRRPFSKPAPTPGLQARRAAVTALDLVLRRAFPLEDALAARDTQRALEGLEDRDRGLAFAIVHATLRRLGTIRSALNARMQKGIPGGSPLEAILAAGAAQILFLDTPPHAAVDLSVRLAKEDKRTERLSGVVNAVLKRLSAEREAVLAADDPLALDTPGWMAKRWERFYGPERARAIALAHMQEPPLDLSVKADAAQWAERLGGRLLPTGSVRLSSAGAIPLMPGFAEGAWWVQDAAAALPARLLGDVAGLRVLDMCAAPGGKTAELAAAGARVTAVDRSGDRLARLRENMARLNLEAEVVEADALTFEAEPFDAVLLDAPCSATGTIRRHPDVAWVKTKKDVDGLSPIQSALLDRAAALVKPGGRLVYATCSLEPEEGEQQARAFLKRHGAFRLVPIDAGEVGGLAELITPEGTLRTLPCHLPDAEPRMAGMDGFFAARFERT